MTVSLLAQIERKREGELLLEDDWSHVVDAVDRRQAPVYQLAALNMAVAIRGLDPRERAALMGACASLGVPPERLELSGIGIERPLYGGRLPAADRPWHAFLAAKRNGQALPADQIQAFVAGVASNEVLDHEIAAFCMAVFLKGMTREEVVALTLSMRDSGDVLTWEGVPGPVVDKHSTGGVGDKISLPLVGVLAALGLYVPMISGRGLGHTGGTLDKMESIPNFCTRLTPEQVQEQVRTHRAMIIGQTARLAPADKRIYAIRDVTGTVPSIPLITASILSKKLAEGLQCLVLDVKVGAGGFMKNLEDGRNLATSLVEVGTAAGVKISALLTRMEAPLGRQVGNASEVVESILCLRGDGPADVEELVVMQAAELLMLSGLAASSDVAYERARATLHDGSALAWFERMVEGQGGDVRYVRDPSLFEQVELVEQVCAPGNAVIAQMDSEKVGRALIALGGGRKAAEEQVDPAVGIQVERTVGDQVSAGQPVFTVRARTRDRMREAISILQASVTYDQTAPAPIPLLLDRR